VGVFSSAQSSPIGDKIKKKSGEIEDPVSAEDKRISPAGAPERKREHRGCAKGIQLPELGNARERNAASMKGTGKSSNRSRAEGVGTEQKEQAETCIGGDLNSDKINRKTAIIGNISHSYSNERGLGVYGTEINQALKEIGGYIV